jgi:hypothetical protein
MSLKTLIVSMCAQICFVLAVATPAAASHRLVTPRAMHEWTRVAVCEEGGWRNAHGPTYYGALGWLDATWLTFKAPWMPRHMDEATPQEQVWAALQFTKRYHFVPDQHGCASY